MNQEHHIQKYIYTPKIQAQEEKIGIQIMIATRSSLQSTKEFQNQMKSQSKNEEKKKTKRIKKSHASKQTKFQKNINPEASIQKNEVMPEKLIPFSEQQKAPLPIIPQQVKEKKFRELYFIPNFQKARFTKISPKNRFILFEWASQTFASLIYKRNALALGCYLFDLYVQNKALNKQKFEDIQLILISCIMLAEKIENQHINLPKVSFCYPLQKILEMERIISPYLNYKLQHKTYISFMTDMMVQWNRIVQKHSLPKTLLYNFDEVRLTKKTSHLYDLLDCINSIVYSLRYNYEDICFNLLFIETYKALNKNKQKEDMSLLNNQEQNPLLAYQSQSHLQVFQEIRQNLAENCQITTRLHSQIGDYLQYFLNIPQKSTRSYYSVVNARYNLDLMTKSTQAYKQAEKILQKLIQKFKLNPEA